MSDQRVNKILMIVLLLIASTAFLLAIYFLPPVHERLSWRVAGLRSEIYYFFNPPGGDIFIPQDQADLEPVLHQTQTAQAQETSTPDPTPTLEPSPTPTHEISPTPTLTSTPTPAPTPIPESVALEGVVWQNQRLYNNNCGPAALSMALSYWGWEGDQTVTAAWLKPNPEDRNVMPYEMVEYIRSQTQLNAIMRWGGDLDMIKNFVAAGFPVIIERGFYEEVADRGWMGHYEVITAYDDAKSTFTVQDSYVGPDYVRPYDFIERHWRAFNYVYIIVYPFYLEEQVFDILGPHLDQTYNLEHAAEKALEEIEVLSGLELFFAWYNYGGSLVNLGDYPAAAQAFDQAFEVYNELPPRRPYRIVWYATWPYFAYFYTGRHQAVIDLADYTLRNSFVPAIEETWVWRGRSRLALGDVDGAVADFREALKWHPGWWVAEAELRTLGVTP